MDVNIINLSTVKKDPIMINETRFIHINENKYKEGGVCRFIKKILNRYQTINKAVCLDITNISVDQRLKIRDKNNLFTIFNDVDKTEQAKFPLKITLSRLKEPFFLMLNSDEIVDCTERQHSNESDTFFISYTLRLTDEVGNEIDSENEKFNIQFTNESNVPDVRFFIKSRQLQYESNVGLRKIGLLGIKLPNILNYAPSVDLRIAFRILYEGRKPIQDLLVLKKIKSGSEIEENNRSSEIIETGLLADKKGKAVSSYELYINLDKISNPLEDISKYTIVSDAEFKYSYDDTYRPFRIDPEEINIKKDPQGTELFIRVFYGEKQLQGEGKCATWNIPEISFTTGSLGRPLKFSILNKATATTPAGAGLTISNLNILTIIDETYSIYDKHSKKLVTDGVVALDNLDPDMRTNSGLFIPNGRNAETNFTISFNPENIYTIRHNGEKTYSFEMTTIIDFDYKEDVSGLGNIETRHYKGKLKWKLVKKPNPEWLCVDFGSSAIVCCYGKGEQSSLIDLREARRKVYEEAKKSNKNPSGFTEDEINDTIENNTSFLSSDILFHDVKESDKTSLCSQISDKNCEKYSNMAVLLSPTEKLSIRNFRCQLPCLKILMGNMYLPNNDHYNNFRYNYLDESNNFRTDVATNLKETEYSLLKIENIFKETYHTLFHFFIQDNTIIEQANKVVLTYPNTYTPYNLQTMKEIVSKVLPEVKEVRFISESDAVAAYYMAHWYDYHSPEENMKADENILVYDMGAGTLDVTYLTKRYDESCGKYNLELCGKIGSGRAGNYLDYIIIQILYDRLSATKFKKSWINTNMKGVEQEHLEARVMLKKIVKTMIKPALNTNETISFNINNNEFEIDPEKILNHELFREFLHKVTEGIWDNIKKYVGDDFRVDTIIMSGRSLRLENLQTTIESLARRDNANCKCIKLDIITHGADRGMRNDRSKTAVIEGAKTFVETYMSTDSPVIIRSRRLQASYGVAFKRTGGIWKYHELLSWKEMPYNDYTGEFSRSNGPLIIENTNESDVIKFIQTYLSEEDTNNAINERNEEFISVMSEIMMSDFGNRASLKMDVIVDRNNNVSLIVYDDNGSPMATKYRSPSGVDLNDTITTKSLWPVSINNE